MKRILGILTLSMILACGLGSTAFAAPFSYGPFVDGTYIGNILSSDFTSVDGNYMKTNFDKKAVDITILGGADIGLAEFGHLDKYHKFASLLSLDGSSIAFPFEIKDFLFNDIVLNRHEDGTGRPNLHSTATSVVNTLDKSFCNFFLAEADMYFAGMSIKAGDVLIGVEFGYVGGITMSDQDYNDLVFVVRGASPTPSVPVPAAVWLLGSGLAGLTALRRRMK